MHAVTCNGRQGHLHQAPCEASGHAVACCASTSPSGFVGPPPPAYRRRHWRGLLLATYMSAYAHVFYELLTCYMGKVGRGVLPAGPAGARAGVGAAVAGWPGPRAVRGGALPSQGVFLCACGQRTRAPLPATHEGWIEGRGVPGATSTSLLTAQPSPAPLCIHAHNTNTRATRRLLRTACCPPGSSCGRRPSHRGARGRVPCCATRWVSVGLCRG